MAAEGRGKGGARPRSWSENRRSMATRSLSVGAVNRNVSEPPPIAPEATHSMSAVGALPNFGPRHLSGRHRHFHATFDGDEDDQPGESAA